MIARILIAIGLITATASFAMIVWSFYSSFEGITTSESAGIAVVSSGIKTALYSAIAVGIGFVIFVIGLAKLINDRKKGKPQT